MKRLKHLTPTFLKHVTDGSDKDSNPKKKRPAPVSVRLNEEELAELRKRAAGQSMNGYIKGQIFTKKRSGKASVSDYEALARALSLLGRSDLQTKLSALLIAIELQNLAVTSETETELRDACSAVKEMRDCLVVALGLKTG